MNIPATVISSPRSCCMRERGDAERRLKLSGMMLSDSGRAGQTAQPNLVRRARNSGWPLVGSLPLGSGRVFEEPSSARY